MEEKAQFGRGMKFPPQVDPATGRFVVATIEESIQDSVYLILMTQKGERPAKPDFGSQILSYPFSDTNPTALHVLERQIKETILTQEPRISEVDVQATFQAEKASLYVNIRYRAASDRIQGGLDFPIELA